MPRASISHIIGSLSTLAIALVVATTLASLPGATPGGAANTNRITIADANAVDAGKHSSLALDTNGFPVISYGVTFPPANNATNGIRVMHCNDVDCSGDDEATFDIETDVPSHTSLALDTNGFPVVAFDSANNILRVLHCNDANCAGNDESITTPDNGFVFGADLQMSMQLDGSGFPVIAYQRTNVGLEIMHCNDVNCAGGDESLTGPTNATLGVQTSVSLKLDANGFPVAAIYRDSTQDLFILHCNDANCAGADESIQAIARLRKCDGRPIRDAGAGRQRLSGRGVPRRRRRQQRPDTQADALQRRELRRWR